MELRMSGSDGLTELVQPLRRRVGALLQRAEDREMWHRRTRPAIWGNLRRAKGFSPPYAEDRGQPVDRYYIEVFLKRHRQLVTGAGLEMHDPGYLRRFGTDLTSVEAMDIRTDNPEATIVGDLCEIGSLPAEAFDCQIITQTIHLVPDMHAAMINLYQALAPGGSLLLTGPVASPSADDLPTDAWRFLPRGLDHLVRKCVDEDADIEVFGYGNRVSAVAFLVGLAWEDLRPRDLEPYDPLCPLIAAARITKPA
jgi:hypothetical protein